MSNVEPKVVLIVMLCKTRSGFSRTMVDLSREFGDAYICADVTYQHVGLLAFAVSRVQPLASLCAVRSDEAKRASELEQLRKLASGAELPRRRRVGKQTAGQAGPAGNTRPQTSSGQVAHPQESDESGQDDRSDGVAPAQSEDGVGICSSSSSEAGGHVASPHLEALAEAGDDALAAQPVTDADAPDPLPQRPRVDQSSGRVFGPSGSYWGRISVLRPGLSSEALSVYCSFHGCSVCKRMSSGVPSQAALLKWLEEGQELPRGRVPALQRRHKAMFFVPEA